MANDILRSSVNKLIINSDLQNTDVVKIETNVLSLEGDVYTIDRRLIQPSYIQTTGSAVEYQPEVSTVYPYKIETPKDTDGATVLLSPDIDIPVTASQNYYTKLYYERYNLNILRSLDKQFTELSSRVAEGDE
jgi:hypothetical protein